jgi:hypothetical protein
LRSLHFRIFFASFLNTFLSPGIAASINMHVPCLLSRTMMSGLLLGIVLSVRTCWFHNMVTLLSCLYRRISVHVHTSLHCLILPQSPCISYSSWTHTVSCLLMYCSFASTGHAGIMCSMSHQIGYRIWVCYYYYYYAIWTGICHMVCRIYNRELV